MPASHTDAAAPAPAAPLPGKRRITRRMLDAQATRPTEWEPAERGRVIGALKRAAPALGIPSRVVGLLDYLVGCTKKGDWLEGGRPVAFPSNAALCDALQLGRTQIKTLIRAAAECDLLAPDDSPTGRRYGRREGGQLVEAYGFDLTPLLARRAEFEAAAAAHQERRREGGRLRARITAARNRVLMLTDAAQMQGLAGGDWPALADAARRLAELRGDSYDPGQLGPLAARLTSLRDLVHDLVRAAVAPGDMPESAPVGSGETDPVGSENRPLTTPTNHLESLERDTAAAGPDRPQAHGNGGSRGRPDSRGTAGRGATGQGASALRGFIVTPDFLLRIAPSFRGWLTTSRPGWGEMVDAAGVVGSELGVSLHAWGQACVVLGRVEAVTVLAVISARHAAGEVRSPGGLLRRMVELHRAGKLRLDRTLFGLADGIDHRR